MIKYICALSLIFFIQDGYSQTEKSIREIGREMGLTTLQVSKIQAIDQAYLQDMHGIKDRADTGYNPPKHIQYQHGYTLFRRFRDYSGIMTPEQVEEFKKIRFDIYPEKDWLVQFYKKNKLPPIETVVEKRIAEGKKHEEVNRNSGNQ